MKWSVLALASVAGTAPEVLAAAAHPYTADERVLLERLRAAAFAGSAGEVAGRLRAECV